MKNLFTSKKTKEKRAAKAASQLMVDEREMRARYSEYKGSKEDLDSKQVSVGPKGVLVFESRLLLMIHPYH